MNKIVTDRNGDFQIKYRLNGSIRPDFSSGAVYRNPATGVIVARMYLIKDPPCTYPCTQDVVLVQFPDMSKILYKDRSFENICAQYIFI